MLLPIPETHSNLQIETPSKNYLLQTSDFHFTKETRETGKERKARGENQSTTARAATPIVEELEEMIVKIGRTADRDATTIKRKQTESQEEMETETDRDGTRNLKNTRQGLMQNGHLEKAHDGRLVANSSNHGLGVIRLKMEGMIRPKHQPNNTNGVGTEGWGGAQSGIEQ